MTEEDQVFMGHKSRIFINIPILQAVWEVTKANR